MFEEKHTDDYELLHRIAKGDEDAYLRLYNAYFKNVFFAARNYLRSEDAHDVCQEIFLTLWRCRTELGHVTNLKNYLITMAVHEVFDRFKRAQVQQRSQLVFLEGLDKALDPESALRLEEYEKLVTEAVLLLPPKQKEVYTLAREHGLTHELIARRLNISQDAVEKNMTRALAFIRTRISPHLLGSIVILINQFENLKNLNQIR